MTQQEYFDKLDELEAKVSAIRQKYNKPSEWRKDTDYKKLTTEIRQLREKGYGDEH